MYTDTEIWTVFAAVVIGIVLAWVILSNEHGEALRLKQEADNKRDRARLFRDWFQALEESDYGAGSLAFRLRGPLKSQLLQNLQSDLDIRSEVKRIANGLP